MQSQSVIEDFLPLGYRSGTSYTFIKLNLSVIER